MQRRKKEGGSLAVTIQPTDHHHPLARFALCVTKTTSRWEEALATLIDTTVPIKKQRFVVPMIFFFFPRQKVARGEYYSGCWTRAIRTHLRRLSALLLGRKWEEEERKKNPGAYIYTHTVAKSGGNILVKSRERELQATAIVASIPPFFMRLDGRWLYPRGPGGVWHQVRLPCFFFFLSLSLSDFSKHSKRKHSFFFSVENFSICCFLFFSQSVTRCFVRHAHRLSNQKNGTDINWESICHFVVC